MSGADEAGPRPDVVLLDYGSGNVHSALRALAAAGARVELTADPRRAREADGLVVPGVGAFAACMAGLRDVGGPAVIADRLAADRAVLGICVGHQVLFESGDEHGIVTDGCGVLPGRVESMTSTRLPHMGWNTVRADPRSRLLAGLDGERFYFVHSYGVHADERLTADAVVSTTEHEGDAVVAVVERGPLAGTQFHPEKSGAAGARLLANWVSGLRTP